MHGTMQMPTEIRNRKGRKRKSGRREANGRPQRVPVDYRSMAALWPGRRDLAVDVRSSERAGSELGRLNLRWQAHEAREAHLRPYEKTPPPGISEDQYEAGRRYAVIVGAYRAMIGVPAHLEGGGRGYDCVGDARCPPDTCICKARQERYDDAYCSIRTHAAHLAVNAVAIHDQAISPDLVIHLREGLSALARHLGLTNGRKSRHG